MLAGGRLLGYGAKAIPRAGSTRCRARTSPAASSRVIPLDAERHAPQGYHTSMKAE